VPEKEMLRRSSTKKVATSLQKAKTMAEAWLWLMINLMKIPEVAQNEAAVRIARYPEKLE